MNETTPNQTTRPEGGIQGDIAVAGNQIVDTVKSLVAKGNVRSIVVRREGRTIVEFPLTVGVIAALLAPQLALLGVFVAVLTQCSIEVQSRPEMTPRR